MTFQIDLILRGLALMFMIAFGLCGCGKSTELSSKSSHATSESNQRTWIRTMEDLQGALRPGMSSNDIIAQFGEPDREDPATEGAIWKYSVYPFPAGEHMPGANVIGVVIGVTNGRLAEWGCAYQGTSASSSYTVREETLNISRKTNDVSSLKFYIVSREPMSAGRFVDTEEFPKLGHIAPKPSLIISNLSNVILNERRTSDAPDSTVWTFIIFLLPEDATRLGLVTSTNVGEQMLITVGDTPVVAARIVSPLETGSFEIECRDRELMEKIRGQLQTNDPRR